MSTSEPSKNPPRDPNDDDDEDNDDEDDGKKGEEDNVSRSFIEGFIESEANIGEAAITASEVSVVRLRLLVLESFRPPSC